MVRELKTRADFPEIDDLPCRFCPVGQAVHTVYDADKKEIFGLCDKHKAEYDIDADSIPAPEPKPEPEPK